MTRLLVALLLLALVTFGGWSIAWYSLAAYAGANLDRLLAGEGGLRLACAERRIAGFPFAFRVSCAGATAASGDGATAGELAGIEVGTGLAQPGRIEAALVSPVRLSTPLFDRPMDLAWGRAAGALDVSLTGLPSPSFSGDGLTSVLGPLAVSVAALAFDAEPVDGGRALRLVARADDLAVAEDERRTSDTDVALSATVASPSGASITDALDNLRRDGLRVPELKLDIVADGSRIAASGALSLDASGYLSGNVDVTVAGLERLPGQLARWPAPVRGAIGPVLGSVVALATDAELDGKPAKALAIRFADGEAIIGPRRFVIGSLFGTRDPAS